MRLISLSGLYVENVSSTKRSQSKTLSTAASSDVLVADVDDDPHPHHMLDGGHTRRPLSSATCSDFSKPMLVSVASEM